MSLTDVVFTVIIMLALAAMVVPAIITLIIEIKCIDLQVQRGELLGNGAMQPP